MVGVCYIDGMNAEPTRHKHIKAVRKLLRHGKKKSVPADVLQHLEALVMTTEMLSTLAESNETEKLNNLLVDFVSYVFRWMDTLAENDALGEEFLNEYASVSIPLLQDIGYTYGSSNEKLLAVFSAHNAKLEAEKEAEEAEEKRLAEEEERERLHKTRCSVCGQPGRYHIKPSFEGAAYSHHVIDLEDGEFVTDIGQTINPPQYFACETCLEHFKVNNPNYDGMKFWKGEEWQRRRNLICDAGVEYHL